jgi:hypothetical protein
LCWLCCKKRQEREKRLLIAPLQAKRNPSRTCSNATKPPPHLNVQRSRRSTDPECNAEHTGYTNVPQSARPLRRMYPKSWFRHHRRHPAKVPSASQTRPNARGKYIAVSRGVFRPLRSSLFVCGCRRGGLVTILEDCSRLGSVEGRYEYLQQNHGCSQSDKRAL